MNCVTIIGNAGDSPKIFRTSTGKVKATISIATNKTYYAEDGEKMQSTKWVPVVVWGRAAEDMEAYVTKGTRLMAIGEFTTRKYEKDGQTRYATELSAEAVGIPFGFASGAQKEEAPQGNGFHRFGDAKPDPSYGPQYQQEELDACHDSQTPPPDNDDLPF